MLKFNSLQLIGCRIDPGYGYYLIGMQLKNTDEDIFSLEVSLFESEFNKISIEIEKIRKKINTFLTIYYKPVRSVTWSSINGSFQKIHHLDTVYFLEEDIWLKC